MRRDQIERAGGTGMARSGSNATRHVAVALIVAIGMCLLPIEGMGVGTALSAGDGSREVVVPKIETPKKRPPQKRGQEIAAPAEAAPAEAAPAEAAPANQKPRLTKKPYRSDEKPVARKQLVRPPRPSDRVVIEPATPNEEVIILPVRRPERAPAAKSIKDPIKDVIRLASPPSIAPDDQSVLRPVAPDEAPPPQAESDAAPDEAPAPPTGMTVAEPGEVRAPVRDDQPAAADVRIVVELPDAFNDAGLPSGALSLRARSGREKMVACDLEDYSDASATGTFLCPRSVDDRYLVALSGFKETEIQDNDGGAGTGARFVWQASKMTSLKSVALLPANPGFDQEGGGAWLPIEADWAVLVSGEGRSLIETYFGSIDPDSADAGRLCEFADPASISPAELVSPESEAIEIRLTCDYILLDYSGLPSPVSQFRPEQCLREGGAGSVCVLREFVDVDGVPAVTIAGGGIWGSATVAIEEGLRLANYVAFAEDFPFYEGENKVPIGDKSIVYKVETATASGGGKNCPGVWRASEPDDGKLGEFVLSRFDCAVEGIVPSKLTLRLNLADDGGLAAPALIPRADFDISVNAQRQNASPRLEKLLPSATLAVSAEGNKLPEFSSFRIYENEEVCQSGTAHMFEAGLSAKSRKIDVSGSILRFIGAGRARIFDGQKPLTSCGKLELASAAADAGALLTFAPNFLRPKGPTALFVLSPSNALAQAGWRAPIQAAIRQWSKALLNAKQPVPVDMVEITENRRTQLIMASEDFSWLPETGDQDSLVGRLDRIRYNAGVARPLEDINLVQNNFSQVEFGRVLFVSDSTNEEFDPRDMGSLYHWLVNRGVDLRVLTLGDCAGWTEWTKNLDNKVDCVALSRDDNASRDGREEKISESLEWLLTGVEGEVQ